MTRVILRARPGTPSPRASSTAPPPARHERRSPSKEVVLSGGAIGSPHVLLLSGIGPRRELEAAGVPCRRRFAARRQAPEGSPPGRARLPGAGRRRLDDRSRHLVRAGGAARTRRASAGGSRRRCGDARRAPGAEAGGRATDHRVGNNREWPRVVFALRRVRLVLHRPRRPPYARRADRLLPVRLQPRHLADGACASTPTSTSTTPSKRLAADAESMLVLANPVQPQSEGEIVLDSADPADHPDDPHELLRRPARHEGHGRDHAPRAGRRGALAGAPDDRPVADPAVPRREARPRRRRRAERRAARGLRAPLLVDRLPPDDDVPDRERRRPAAARRGGRAGCASPTRASCRTWSAATRTRRRS